MPSTAPFPCRPLLIGFAWALAAILTSTFCAGFTVDDAWIVSRVAENGAAGRGYVVNPGQISDAVTPYGYAHLLGVLGSALGAQTGEELFQLARALGFTAHALGFGFAGWIVARTRLSVPAWTTVAIPLLCVPAALWAGAGLTGPLVSLVILGAFYLLKKGLVSGGALVAGAAGAWRPELIPVLLGAGCLLPPRASLRQQARGSALLLTPFACICALRMLHFGHPLPLSFAAKAPDFASGLRYAAVAMIWTGLPWLLLFQRAQWSRQTPFAWLWLLHLLAVVYAGGDWMPGMRLVAPLLLPLSVEVAANLRLVKAQMVGLLLCGAVQGSLLLSQGDDYRAVTSRRELLVQQAAPHLQSASVVAAVDIGWVGMSARARIVDLAGVTDPVVARLPGGHTSKLLSPGFFSARSVDTWIIRAVDRAHQPGQPLENIAAVYFVDARLLAANSELGFVSVAAIPLPGTAGQYVIARRKD